ncbi:MAG: hypothetical protein J6M16_02045 [Clostridia bacterium]|nr:hypothetical protein [Clostridia bacterium]
MERISVKGRIELNNNGDIMSLFSMTPYYWKTDAEGSGRLKNQNSLSTEIEFNFLVYRKM